MSDPADGRQSADGRVPGAGTDAGSGSGARTGPGAASGRALLAVIAGQQLLMAYDSTAMNVALSDIVDDLDTSLTAVQSPISLYALVMAAFMITGSKLGARVGHLRIFVVGSAVYGTGALLTALSPNLPVMLVGWSLLAGIGAALVLPAVLSLATLTFSGARRTRALALVGAASGVGAALGPVLGGVFTTYLSWRVSFLMEAVCTVLVVLVARRQREPERERARRPFDVTGVVLSALGLGLVVTGMLLAGRYGLLTAREDVTVLGWTMLRTGDVAPTVVLVLAGLVVLELFTWWERHLMAKGRDPLVRMSVLRDRTIRVGSLTLATQYLVMFGVLFLVPVFVRTTLGYNAVESGIALLPSTVALVAASLYGIRLVNRGRVTRQELVVLGFVLIATGTALIALTFDPDASALRLAPGLAVAGLGLGLCTLLPDLVQSSAPAGAVSDVAGLSRGFSALGQSLGVALGGALMIGVLLDTATDAVRDSAVLTNAQKITVDRALREDVQLGAADDDQVRASLRERGVTGAPADELVRINADARDNGLTAAVTGMGVFALLGIGLAARIPGRRRPRGTDPKGKRE